MKKLAKGMAALFTASLLFSQTSEACTDIRIMAKDGTVMVARSMEFAVDMKANLRSSNRGRNFAFTAPNGKAGITWKAKYGYVFLDGFNIDAAIDGMNEAGLTFEALYLPGFAQYQTVPEGQETVALPYFNLGDWVLSNFKSVDEVKQFLPRIFVFPQTISGVPNNMIFPLHFSIYDATGKGIVVEYVGGKMTIYDNKIGVLTNSPTYDWHINNLNNYVHLAPINPPAVMDKGEMFGATGQGFGMIGLPGDSSPPSRFVRVATMARVAVAVNDATGALNLAQHIMNTVDIPRGLIREPVSGNYIDETTQWTVFKDITHKVFYYKTYDNLNVRAISLGKVDFSENAQRLSMPIATPAYVIDDTNKFLQAK